MRLGQVAALTAALIVSMPANAQTITAPELSSAALAECMLAHADAAFEQQVKTVLLDAISDNTEALNGSAMAMGLTLLMIAQRHCGLKMTDLESPHFEEAAGILGQTIGERIIAKAMAKLGQ